MKALIPLLALLFLMSFTLKAQAKGFRMDHDETLAVQEILGDLIVRNYNAHPEMVIRAYDKDIVLSNVHSHWRSCVNGIFIITEDQEPQGKARLLDVVDCQEELAFDIQAHDAQEQMPVFCPEIYQPVCGLKALENLNDLSTFPNLCYLNNAKADFLHHGECHSL